MDRNQHKESPNSVLAHAIVEGLKGNSLIHPDDADVILNKLETGSAKAADWNRWVERILDERLRSSEE
jgi:hypothetical protein